jgi:uncharacterized protein (TIRG00374 family)
LAARLVGVLVALVVLYATFRNADPRRVVALVEGVGPSIAWVLLPYAVAMALEALSWQWLLAAVGQRLGFWPLYGMVLVGEALQNALPAGVVFSEASKPTLFRRWCGRDAPLALAAMAGRKYLRVSTHALYSLLAFFLGFSFLRLVSRSEFGADGLEWSLLVIAALLAALAAGSVLAFQKGALAKRIHAGLTRLPFVKLKSLLERKRSAFEETDRLNAELFSLGPRKLAAPFSVCLAAWMLEAVETWLILHLLGAELSFGAVIGCEVGVLFLRQILVLLPAGLGVQDFGYVSYLAALGVPNAVELGAAFSVLKRGKEALYIAFGLTLPFLAPEREEEEPSPVAGASD